MQYRETQTVECTDIYRRLTSGERGTSRISSFRVGVEQSILFTLVILVWGMLIYEALLSVH